MLKNLTQFYYPKSVEEACQMLKDSKVKTTVIAGGTSETLRNTHDIVALIDISRLSEITYLKSSKDSIKIGAATPVQDIYKSDLSGVSGELLKTTCGRIASTLLRNGITAGGSIAGLQWWSDMPVILMALDAETTYTSGKKNRTAPVMTDSAKKGEIISEITVPQYGKGTGATFDKMVKTHHDYSTCTAATRITIEKGKIKEARIVVGALTDRPTRVEAAEKLLIGQKPSEELIEKAAEKTADSIKYRRDYRVSSDYQHEMCKVMVRRSLTESADKAGK